MRDFGSQAKSVGGNEDEAYQYWKKHFNHNPDDCCNLRKEQNGTEN